MLGKGTEFAFKCGFLCTVVEVCMYAVDCNTSKGSGELDELWKPSRMLTISGWVGNGLMHGPTT